MENARKLVKEHNKALIEALQNTKNWTQAFPSCPNGPTMRDGQRLCGKLDCWDHSLTPRVTFLNYFFRFLEVTDFNTIPHFALFKIFRNKHTKFRNKKELPNDLLRPIAELHLKCEILVCFVHWVSNCLVGLSLPNRAGGLLNRLLYALSQMKCVIRYGNSSIPYLYR